MNTSALNELLDIIQRFNLTEEEKQWLASRLCNIHNGRPASYEIKEESTGMAREAPPLEPYTMEEIDARLDEAEREFEAGGGIDNEEVFREAWNRMYKVQYV